VIEAGALIWPMLASAALVGLAGGVHCVGMCGGIVAALAGATGQRQPGMRLHLAYSVGRILSYGVAGALAGGAGGVLGWAGSAALGARGSMVGQSLFMLAASLMLIMLGLYLSGLAPAVRHLESLGAGLWRRLQPLARPLLPAATPVRAAALGAIWGFLPCGLVYAMLVTAMATGSPALGAAVLVAFGLGTLPNLLAVGLWLSRFRAIVRAPRARLVAGAAVCMFGLYGLVLFGQGLASGGNPHAHHHHAVDAGGAAGRSRI
jgi:sulfite exporter TauE/SafE